MNFTPTEAARRSSRLRFAALAVATLFCGCGLALFAEADEPMPTPHSEPVKAAPAWLPINRPFELYSLEAPEVSKLAKSYEARRLEPGGGRQDVLTYGGRNLDGAFFQLTLYRLGSEEAVNPTLFVDLARRAADTGLAVTHSQPPGLLPTRFGDAEVSDITLTASAGQALPCLGFRVEAKSLPWRMTGFACGGTKPLPRPALQCFFDRLDLNTAGEDRALAKFFAEAELRRSPGCSGTRLTPSPVQVHASWLDETAVPPALKTLKR